MAGHSRWAQIKHKKARTDVQRGKLFSKLIRELVVATKQGGSDPSYNSRLRLAIDRARLHNMPQDTIDRAIKRATVGAEGIHLEHVVYEGYGPGSAAILVHCLTDNRNRTAGEIRHIFSKYGGNLAGLGSVAWLFKECGTVVIQKLSTSTGEEDILSLAMNVGVEDIQEHPDSFELRIPSKQIESVKQEFQKAGYEILSADIVRIPQSTVRIGGKTAEHLLKLLQALEDHEDVQSVDSNFDIPEEILETAPSTP